MPKSRTRVSLILFAIATSWTALHPNQAYSSFSVLDGGVLDMDTSAMHFKIGVPNLGMDYLTNYNDEMDFGFGLLVNYLSPSFEPSFLLRRQIAEGFEHNIGLSLRAAIHWNTALMRDRYYPKNLGVRLTPGVVVGMHPHPTYSSYFLVETPVLWTFGYGGGFSVPIRAGMGFEFAMTPDSKFVAYAGGGPKFEGGGGYVGGVYLDLDIWLGLSFQMF